MNMVGTQSITGVRKPHLLTVTEYANQRRMPALDGLRGLAVALVITCHLHNRMWTALSGYVGVTIFFVLSGYLITRLALVEEAREGYLHLRAFFLRRFFRIFPLYYFFLGLYCLLILYVKLWPDKIAPFRGNLLYYVFYFQEIPFFRSQATQQGLAPFYHSWSLGIEEKFYLAWPFLFVLAASSTSRVRVRTAISCVGAALCVVQGAIVENTSAYDMQHYGFIFMGILLALTLQQDSLYVPAQRWLARCVGVALVLMLLVQFYLMPYHMHRGFSAVYALATTVLLGYLVTSQGLATRLLSAFPLVFLGRISYGIYLCHILALGIVEKLARPGSGKAVGVVAYVGTLALSVCVALLTYKIVESPMIRLGHRWSERLMRRARGNETAYSELSGAVSVQKPEQG